MKSKFYKLFDVPVRNRDLCFFDIEMAALRLDAEIIELGAIRTDQKSLNIIKEIEIKIKPEKIEDADEESLKVVGYNEEEWKDAVLLKDGINQFLDFIDGSILVSSNLPFDWMWLHRAVEEMDLEPRVFYKGICIFSLAWLIFKDKKEFPKLSLGELARYFGIEREREHRALDDTRTTYKVFAKLIEEYEKTNNTN
jgi:DNA polymerase-3 subunit epsilon